MEDGQAIERSPLGYEFRIFPAAQHYELKPGSLVFVNLRSDKNSGLARVKPAQLPVGQVSEVEKRIAQPQVTAEPGKHRTSEENPGAVFECACNRLCNVLVHWLPCILREHVHTTLDPLSSAV